MRLLHSLSKPEFLFRPSQIFRRLAYERAAPTEQLEVVLPWGLPISVNPRETVGSCIARQGLYDLSGCESIWRLLEEGESALDVGANIGQMTSLMLEKTGSQGIVHAFEPHPIICKALRRNVTAWNACSGHDGVVVHEIGLSDKSGNFNLYMPKLFDGNNGVASLEKSVDELGTAYDVKVSTLDEVFQSSEHFGLMKIDIEGHELSALRGGISLLSDRRVRDIVFEDNSPLPTQVSALLTRLGYKIYYIDANLFGPNIISIDKAFKVRSSDAPNYLATLNPGRAESLFKARGWACLR